MEMAIIRENKKHLQHINQLNKCSLTLIIL